MGEMGNRKKISSSWFSLIQHTSPLSGYIQNLKTLALIAGEYYVVNFMRKKENKTNKWNDTQEDADSLLHNTTSQTKCLYKLLKL